MVKWQAKRSISCRGGLTVQAASRKRSGSAGAWTVPPGGLRFYQLALPNEAERRRRFCVHPYCAAILGAHGLAYTVTKSYSKNKPAGLFAAGGAIFVYQISDVYGRRDPYTVAKGLKILFFRRCKIDL
jgi:hypothetical protein